MKTITVRHSGHCTKCGDWIMKGEKALWDEGKGISHDECPNQDLPVDDTRLVVIDPDPDFYLK